MTRKSVAPTLVYPNQRRLPVYAFSAKATSSAVPVAMYGFQSMGAAWAVSSTRANRLVEINVRGSWRDGRPRPDLRAPGRRFVFCAARRVWRAGRLVHGRAGLEPRLGRGRRRTAADRGRRRSEE